MFMLLREKKSKQHFIYSKRREKKAKGFFFSPSMTSFAQENIDVLPKFNWLAAKRISYESANSHGPKPQQIGFYLRPETGGIYLTEPLKQHVLPHPWYHQRFAKSELDYMIKEPLTVTFDTAKVNSFHLKERGDAGFNWKLIYPSKKEKKTRTIMVLLCFQVLTIWKDDTSNENNQEPDLPHSDW